jgi:hypothetical protein
MKMKRTREITATSGDVSSGTGVLTINLEKGFDIAALFLAQPTTGSFTLGQIGRVETFLGGDSIQHFKSGTDLDAYNQYQGIPAFAALGNVLCIPYCRFNTRDRAFEDTTMLPYDGTVVPSLYTEIEFIGATTPRWSGGHGPKMLADTPVSSSRIGGQILRVFQTSAILANGVIKVLGDLPIGKGRTGHGLLEKLLFVQGAGTVSTVDVELDQVRWARRTNVEDAAIKATQGSPALPAYYSYAVDATENGTPDDLDLSSYTTSDGKLVVNVTSTVAETVPVVAVFAGPVK